jgi:hypothetical protein
LPYINGWPNDVVARFNVDLEKAEENLSAKSEKSVDCFNFKIDSNSF